MCCDKPEAIICLLCKAAFVQKEMWRDAVLWSLISCFCCSHPLLQSMLRLVTAPQFSCWTLMKLSLHYCSPLWEQCPCGNWKMSHHPKSFQDRWPTLHTFSVITCNTRAFKDISTHYFGICESVPNRKVCLSAWKCKIRVYRLISAPDQTKDLVSLRNISAETYGVFQFAFT